MWQNFVKRNFYNLDGNEKKFRNVFAIKPSLMSCDTKKSKGINSDIPAAALNEVIGLKALNC